VYSADTYQLIRAGLSGGKGVPDTVATHPCVFATLIAPSFGPVHLSREKRQPAPALPSAATHRDLPSWAAYVLP
jgi:hypothetical protein